MGRVKRCRECGGILYCKDCGARQTPLAPEKSRYTMLFTKEQRKTIELEAQDRGLTVAAYIRNVLGLDLSDPEVEESA